MLSQSQAFPLRPYWLSNCHSLCNVPSCMMSFCILIDSQLWWHLSTAILKCHQWSQITCFWEPAERKQWCPFLRSNHAPSFRSLAVDHERMIPVGAFCWFGSVLWVYFSALTLLVGWQEGHLTIKSLCHLNSQRFFSGRNGGRKPKSNLLTRGHL